MLLRFRLRRKGDIGPVGDGNMTVAIKRGVAPSDGLQAQLAVVDILPVSTMTDIRGVAIQLTHYASMIPCRGSRDFITTYGRETVSRPVRDSFGQACEEKARLCYFPPLHRWIETNVLTYCLRRPSVFRGSK